MSARHRPGLDPASLELLEAKADSIHEMMREARNLPLEKVHPNPHQPRKTFDPHAHEELKSSIKALGILEPLLVRPDKDGYEVICGERRYRVAKELDLSSVPVVIHKVDDLKALRMAYEENVQREDLCLIDEARFLQGLVDRGVVKTRQDLAESLRISKGRISQKLAILNLPSKVQEAFASHPFLGELHARVLSQVEDEEARDRVLTSIVSHQLSGRQAEALVERHLAKTHTPRSKTKHLVFKEATLRRDGTGLLVHLPDLDSSKLSALLLELAHAIRDGKVHLPPHPRATPAKR